MSVSLDGYATGPDVSVDAPMGVGGERLHEWLFHGNADTGVNAEIQNQLIAASGAAVIGRRMFDLGAPIWGDVPFPVPTFVVTHEVRPPLPQRSADFTFVGGVAAAIEQARTAAGDRDVVIMGGPSILDQAVRGGFVDEIQLQIVPVLLGAGTKLFDALGAPSIELRRLWTRESDQVTHVRYRVLAPGAGQSSAGL